MRKNIAIGILCAALVALGIWGYQKEGESETLSRRIEDQYAQSFQTLNDTVRDIATKLGKCAVSTDQSFLAYTYSEISKLSSAAQEMLSRLPISHLASSETASFLSKTEDFSAAMLKKRLGLDEINVQDRASTKALETSARAFNESLNQFIEDTKGEEGGYKWLKNASSYLASAEENSFTRNLTSVDESMVDYPSMIYDGPFSDHLVNEKPRGLTGSDVTKEEAQAKLKKVENAETKFVSEINSDIPCYVFHVTNGSETRAFYISKAGGHLISSTSSSAPKASNISMSDAQKKAEAFLKGIGIDGMAPSYYENYQNIGVFNFCCTQNGVKEYSDLIKVQVSLENGKIIGYEATGYYMNHHPRQLPSPVVTSAQARAKLNSDMKVTSESLALIPTKGKNEFLCYEFKGTVGDTAYIVYIDVQNGVEREIFQVIEADNSVLVL
ncbi:MAG: germination protein YpeB [Eubacteriaceae bacterium]|jgi:spore germination protein|nr:germination protein YpeB [Eubacteriaceae bacterium]